jgi:uncharacterized protein YlaI
MNEGISGCLTFLLSVALIGGLGYGVVKGFSALVDYEETRDELTHRRGETLVQTDVRHLPKGGPYLVWDPDNGLCYSMMRDTVVTRVADSPVHPYLAVPCTDKIKNETVERRQALDARFRIKPEQDQVLARALSLGH